MKFYKQKDIPRFANAALFRQSCLGSCFMALFLGAFAVGFLCLAVLPIGHYLFWIPFIFLGLLTLLPLASLRFAFQDSNWTVRIGDRGLLLNLRSYLNSHFPDDSPSVVELDRSDVEAIRISKEKRWIPRDPDEAKFLEKQSYLELFLRGEDLSALREHLQRELMREAPQGRFGRSKFLHYPVRFEEPNLLRISWVGPNDWVRPSLKKAMPLLARLWPVREEKFQELHLGDDPDLLQKELLFLRESGRAVEAIKLARRRLGLGLAEAKSYIEQLRPG